MTTGRHVSPSFLQCRGPFSADESPNSSPHVRHASLDPTKTEL